ncbi:MAG: TrmH family RNA methyltransferase [Vicinamibacterales bacterium]
MKTITSRQNPIVGAFRELADTPDPAGRRLLLDGPHLVRDALDAGLEFELAAVARAHDEDAGDIATLADALRRRGVELVTVNDAVFDALSPVRTPAGIVAIARREQATVDHICRDPRALIVAALDVQDPGNLGSLIRAAEAGGATGLLVGGASAHPFGWKALRGSMGSALRLPIAAGLDAPAIVEALRSNTVRMLATTPHDGRNPDDVDWVPPCAVLLGGEGAGLPPVLIDAADERVTIPMAAPVESLNVAVAGALLIYAARRQRMS